LTQAPLEAEGRLLPNDSRHCSEQLRPFLALGAWILTVGWFGFNVMSAQTIDKISGLVAVNSLMAMVGGTLAALALGRNDPGSCTTGRWPAWRRSAPART
jgi:ammonia channel protein AmtB